MVKMLSRYSPIRSYKKDIHYLFGIMLGLAVLALLFTLSMEIGPARFHFLDPFLAALLCMLFLTRMIRPKLVRVEKITTLDRLVILVFFSVSISTLLSYDWEQTIAIYMDWMRVVSFYYIGRVLWGRNLISIGGVRKIWVLCGYILLGVGVLQILTGSQIGLIANYFGEQVGENLHQIRDSESWRISGTTRNPIVYGLWINIFVSYIIFRSIYFAKYYRALVFGILTGIVLFYTFTIGTLATYFLLVGLGFVLIPSGKAVNQRLMTLVVCLCVFVIVGALSYHLGALEVLSKRIDNPNSRMGRVNKIVKGARLLSDPKVFVFGIGAGNFYAVSEEKGFFLGPNPWKEYSHSRSGIHNVLFKVIIEYGVITLLVFIGCCVALGNRIVKLYSGKLTGEEEVWVRYSAVVGIVFLLVAAQLYESVLEYYIMIPVALIASFITSLPPNRNGWRAFVCPPDTVRYSSFIRKN